MSVTATKDTGTLALMQPYFLPYIGYFQLIAASDTWITFDTCQFIRHGWIERNRIRNTQGHWQYIKVPLEKHHQKTSIGDIRIRTHEDWKSAIFAQLTVYKNIAPYYNKVLDVVKEALSPTTNNITELNVHALRTICEYIHLPFEPHILSEMHLGLAPPNAPGDWALNIAKCLGATCYINPVGGKAIFDTQKFSEAGLDIRFLETPNIQGFDSDLSIVHTLMYYSPQDVHNMMTSYSANPA